MDLRDHGKHAQLRQYARHRLPDRLGLQPGVHALIRFDLRRSISQRPAGPGGVSVLNTADIAMTRLASGISSIPIFTSDPFAKSVSITPTGMPPQPRPARKKACFAPRSASRQVFAEKTPKSFPCDSSERSVRTSRLCCARTRAGIGPLSDAKRSEERRVGKEGRTSG